MVKKSKRAAKTEESGEPDVDYSIKCHNTLCADGTVLDNNAPAPPELIKWHEKKLGLTAPPEVSTWPLTDVNLYFLSGGQLLPKD